MPETTLIDQIDRAVHCIASCKSGIVRATVT